MADSKQSCSSNSGGGCGCFSLILSVLLMWFLCFGATVGGKHYELSCDTEHGVTID